LVEAVPEVESVGDRSRFPMPDGNEEPVADDDDANADVISPSVVADGAGDACIWTFWAATPLLPLLPVMAEDDDDWAVAAGAGFVASRVAAKSAAATAAASRITVVVEDVLLFSFLFSSLVPSDIYATGTGAP
jgi:hypothetical protein